VDQRVPPPAPRKSGRAVIVQANGVNPTARRFFEGDDDTFFGAASRFPGVDHESKKVQDQEAGIKETIPTPMSIFSLSRRPSQVQPALTPVDRRVPPPAPLSPVTPLVDQRVPPPAPRKSGRAVIVQVNGGNMVSRRLFDDDERFSGAV